MVFFRFSPVNGGYDEAVGRIETHQSVSNMQCSGTEVGMNTYCSCQHVIHESSQTPPVHCSVVSTPHQDLWSPLERQGGGRDR